MNRLALVIATCGLIASARATDATGVWLSIETPGIATSAGVTVLTLRKDHTFKIEDPKVAFEPDYSTGKWSQKGANVYLLNKWQLANHKASTQPTFRLSKDGNTLKEVEEARGSYRRKKH